VGGDPSLDFVNTVDWTPGGLEHDRLGSYDRLVIWARGAGVLSERQAHALRDATARAPDKAQAAYEAARWTRWVLHEVFSAVVTRRPLADALAEFGRLLARAHQHLDLAPASAGRRRRRDAPALTWAWRGMPEQLECLLWPVVRSAATLLTSPDAGRLRLCAGPDCGWLYVDRSRNGLRRWCEMRTCGTLAKSRRRATRRRGQRRRSRVLRTG
jgi:predicted RNA-binding Zn ribbon-like protein